MCQEEIKNSTVLMNFGRQVAFILKREWQKYGSGINTQP
jgi:hypothetical protein